MDDLIPLLILIAISVIGALGKKKKRRPIQQQDQPVQPPRKERDDIFSWLESLSEPEELDPYQENTQPVMMAADNMKEEQVEPVKEVQVEVKDNKYHKYTGFISTDEKNNLMRDGGRKSFTEEIDKMKKDPIQLTEISEKKKHWMLEDFELRKAVVFSEILNRKY